MTDLTTETLAEWRKDAEAARHTTCGCGRILALLNALAAEKARMPWDACTGAGDCPGPWHVHGCYADLGKCDDPMDHHGPLLAAEKANAKERNAAEARVAALEAGIGRVRRALDDELQNLADDGARLSHSVVRRIEAALTEKGATCSTCGGTGRADWAPGQQRHSDELRRTIAGLRGTVDLMTEDRNREHAEKCALLHERALERQAAARECRTDG